MKAMVLAAGFGKRMLPLTQHCPKPLLPVAGKPLLQYHLEKIAASGVREVLVNVSHLADVIIEWLDAYDAHGLTVSVSRESAPLETGGAIANVLGWLGDEPFLLVNGDVWSDCSYNGLVKRGLSEVEWGRLVLVQNPPHNDGGDFGLQDDRLVALQAGVEGFTFSGISVLRPQLVAEYPHRRSAFPLNEVFRHGIRQRRLSGEVYAGQWWDVGTPERLGELDQHLRGLI